MQNVIKDSQTYAREFRARSWWHFHSTFAVATALAATICLVPLWQIRVPASLALGLVLVRVFIIFHDVQHGTILKGSRLAALIMRGYGVLVLNPPSIWKRSHDHHHRNIGRIQGSSIGSFPVMTSADWKRASRWQRLSYLGQRHPLTIAAGYVTIFFYGMCIRSFVVDPRRHVDSAIAVVLHAAIVVLLAIFFPATLLFLVLVPMALASAIGAYLFFAQHNFPSVEIMERHEWTYARAALGSSSYIRMGPVMRWFTGNIGYHHVHHVNAKIPFYRLPEAMAGIPALQSPGTTSLTPRQIWKCLRLRVWDASTGRMAR